MNNIQIISSTPTPSEVKTSFRGPLFRYPIALGIDRNKGTLMRWIVLSNGKQSTLNRYLFGKWLWDELNQEEWRIFCSLPVITKDLAIYLSLKAQILVKSKKLIRKRLEIISSLLGLTFVTRRQYLSIKGQCVWFFRKESINLKKTPKYSGYTKHHRDHGSLGPEREENFPELVGSVRNDSEEFILHYLIVGELPSIGGYVVPDEVLKRTETIR